jgi:hypothetical protein
MPFGSLRIAKRYAKLKELKKELTFIQAFFSGLLVFILGLFCCWATINTRIDSISNLFFISLLFISGIFLMVVSIFSIRTSIRYRNFKKFPTNILERVLIDFKDNQIIYPFGYFFTQSSISKTKTVKSDEIKMAFPFHSPPSILIENKEIIFLKYDNKDDLIKFAKNHGISISHSNETWELINRSFLDTELSFKEKKETYSELFSRQFSKTEIRTIRKKIKWTMCSYTYGMEWSYLGQFDYLVKTLVTKNKYWWTMEIATRNIKNFA